MRQIAKTPQRRQHAPQLSRSSRCGSLLKRNTANGATLNARCDRVENGLGPKLRRGKLNESRRRLSQWQKPTTCSRSVSLTLESRQESHSPCFAFKVCGKTAPAQATARQHSGVWVKAANNRVVRLTPSARPQLTPQGQQARCGKPCQTTLLRSTQHARNAKLRRYLQQRGKLQSSIHPILQVVCRPRLLVTPQQGQEAEHMVSVVVCNRVVLSQS